MKITAGKPFIKGTKEMPLLALAGILSLSTSAFSGSINLVFPEKIFLDIMSKMLAEEFTVLTDDLASGATELLNIIYGNAKVVLNQQGHSVKMAIPTVVRGQVINSPRLNGAPILVLPFVTEFGEFYIEIIEKVEVPAKHEDVSA